MIARTKNWSSGARPAMNRGKCSLTSGMTLLNREITTATATIAPIAQTRSLLGLFSVPAGWSLLSIKLRLGIPFFLGVKNVRNRSRVFIYRLPFLSE